MARKTLWIIILIIMPAMIYSQEDSTIFKHRKRIGLNGFPVVAYDADMGFQYGVMGELYDYGKPNIYPNYKQKVKVEISRFTRGSGVNQVFYDAKDLIPGHIRLTADLSYLTEKALDFYGFNGYQAVYKPEWEDDTDPAYITRMFYRHERKMFRFTADFQGPFSKKNQRFLWLAGIGIMNFKIGPVDIQSLNKGKKEDKKLPDTITLFQIYNDDFKIIQAGESDGGNINFIKAGLVMDTRDNENLPWKGLWEELLFVYSPEFFFNEQDFLKLILVHRQYFTLIKNKLGFTYRLGYQGTIAGHSPFYFDPYMLSSYSIVTKTDGLGGGKTMRGVLRNRVVGDGVAYGNLEFRSRLVDLRIAGANFYIGANVFFDAGLVVQNVDFDREYIDPAVEDNFFDFSYQHDRIHPGAGAGLRVGWNENFIVAFDYGFAMNKQDGKGGFYITFGNLW